MYKRIIDTLLLSIVLLCLTGCWDRVEINDIAIVGAFGYDLTKEGMLEGTALILDTTNEDKSSETGKKGAKQPPYIIVSAVGRSVNEILKLMQEQLSRRIFLGQRSIFIFGENYAKQGISFMDALSRNPASQIKGFVFTTRGKTAKEMLESPYVLETTLNNSLLKIEESKHTKSTKLYDLLNMFYSNEQNIVTPAISLSSEHIKIKPDTYQIDGTALYKNNKLVGYLSREDSNGLFWLTEDVKNFPVTVAADSSNETITSTFKIKTRIKPFIKDNLLNVNIECYAKGNVLENNSSVNLTHDQELEQIEGKNRIEIQKKLMDTIEKLQKINKVDSINIGDAVRRKLPSYWRINQSKWETIYEETPIHIHVNVKLLNTGRSP